MSADLLRQAADVLRERAGKATPEYGWNFHDGGVRSDGTQPADSGLIAFISLMSPTVGLALADLLEKCADGVERRGVTARITPTEAQAFDLARLIVGGDA